MKDHHANHLLQYSILVLIFLFSVPLLFIFTDFLPKISIILGLSLMYFLVGLVHHKEERNLNRTIILEYLAVSLLIFVVLFSLFG